MQIIRSVSPSQTQTHTSTFPLFGTNTLTQSLPLVFQSHMHTHTWSLSASLILHRSVYWHFKPPVKMLVTTYTDTHSPTHSYSDHRMYLLVKPCSFCYITHEMPLLLTLTMALRNLYTDLPKSTHQPTHKPSQTTIKPAATSPLSNTQLDKRNPGSRTDHRRDGA